MAVLLLNTPVEASPLDDARNAGQVVEKSDGYVKASGSVAPNVQKLVADVNKRRKSAYQKIAKKNGITIEQVAAESYRQRMKKQK